MLFWSLGELWIPLFCPLGSRACVVPIVQKVQFYLFFILSFLFVLFLRKFMADYLFRSVLRLRSSQFSFSPSFFFIFFLKWVESHSASLKVFCCYSFFFFIPLHFGSPRYHPLTLWEVTPGFLLFLLDHLVPEKDMLILYFLVFFWLFPLSYLNPFLTVLHASGIPSLLAASEDSNSAFFLRW